MRFLARASSAWRVALFLLAAGVAAVAIDLVGRAMQSLATRLPDAPLAVLPAPIDPRAISPTTIQVPDDMIAIGAKDRPFGQVHAWHEWLSSVTWAAITVSIVVVIVSLLFAPRVEGTPSTRGWRRSIPTVAPLMAIPLAGGLLAWEIVSRAPQAFWDEAFVFASQARDLATNGVAGVATTGPHAFAESSADAGITYVGGLMMAIVPSLHGETAVVVAAITLATAFALTGAVLLYRWFGVTPVAAGVVSTVVILLQAGALAAAASAFGTMAATGALVVLVLATLRSFQTRRSWPLVVAGVTAGLIRWDYGFVALGALITLALVVAWSSRGRWRASWGAGLRGMVVGLVVAVAVLGSEALYRAIRFGDAVPSGVAFKRMGLDGAYISSGIGYLLGQRDVIRWDVLLAFAVAAIIFLAKGWRGGAAVAAIIAVFPMVASVVAGGDWFSPFWSRYIIPTAGALTVLLVVVVVTAVRRAVRAPARRRSLVAWAAVAPVALLVVVSLAAIRPFWAENSGGYREGRLACLAATGKALDALLPPGQGVATAEVNTVGYYSQRPLTDLIGLVDPRVATAPAEPLSAGNVLHRRRNPGVLSSDEPGAIYLFEGAACGPGSQSRNANAEAWAHLLTDPITRYRIGDVAEVLKDYAPVTVITPDSLSLNVLIRRSALPHAREAAARARGDRS